jgi:hypothetical protein
MSYSDPSALSQSDHGDHGLRLIVFGAAEAHQNGLIEYEADGTVVCRHPDLSRRGRGGEIRIPTERQYPAIRATFDDLNKALSRFANSPLIGGSRTLRQLYEEEVAHYEELSAAAHAEGRWEPDYGSYVLDHWQSNLYLVAPEQWHRLALITSNSMLLTDPAGRMSWQQVRQRLESTVVGVIGASVGGNVLEGWLRVARPRQAKIADPDWVESTNFNRGERMSIRHIVASRAERFDPRSPYETPRVLKAEYLAYEQQLVDPYVHFHVYREGLTRENIERFLLGDGQSEPPLDVVVEEMDDPDLKVLVREVSRKHRIDVLMMSDFGHRVHTMWNRFKDHPDERLGYQASDEVLHRTLTDAKKGDRNKTFEFVAALCGGDFAGDQFQAWIEGKGEQPTSSLPQSGATAMASGAIGGKEIALHVLGWRAKAAKRVIYDLLNRRVEEG